MLSLRIFGYILVCKKPTPTPKKYNTTYFFQANEFLQDKHRFRGVNEFCMGQ